MTKVFYALAVAVSAVLSVATVAATANDIMVVAGNEVDRIVTLRNVSIKNGEVSGEVVNNSSDTLRDVVVEIRYSWLWADEYHPGKDDPGRTVYYTAAKGIPPGGSARFEYKPSPPLPVRRDGSFLIDVKIAGFERVYRQRRIVNRKFSAQSPERDRSARPGLSSARALRSDRIFRRTVSPSQSGREEN